MSWVSKQADAIPYLHAAVNDSTLQILGSKDRNYEDTCLKSSPLYVYVFAHSTKDICWLIHKNKTLCSATQFVLINAKAVRHTTRYNTVRNSDNAWRHKHSAAGGLVFKNKPKIKKK